ncbi:hypothetical protein [Streptodolium elevatio]|uniref:Transcriptional regulator n=1 Tax=Streptodolium elevatio TaxID=3157996 RepID=A0ABV3DI91_9ACTN
MNAGIPGMRQVRVGTPTPRALADLGLLRRDDELVETLRLRNGRPQGDRLARLFHALLAEVDAVPGGRRAVTDRC